MKKVIYKKTIATAGGWGSVRTVVRSLIQEHITFKGSKILLTQNKVDGFACVSCAWAKPSSSLPFEFCQNGAMATAWELTKKTANSDFFNRYKLSELENWSDFDLEKSGRLTTPLRWNAEIDQYVSVSWEFAINEIALILRPLDPKSVVWYTSGRASLETSYIYSLMVRMYGSNNLPDSSNMCHESSSVGLQESIGVGVGTVVLEDFEKTDFILFFGQNVGTNSPRMLHDLQDARRRGVPIVTFNPLKEPGLISFVNPQAPLEMMTNSETKISTQYHQVKPGGDIAALTGICKALFTLDDESITKINTPIFDVEFMRTHTHGFETFKSYIQNSKWELIESESGLNQDALEKVAIEYSHAKSAIAIYGMGITQHREGVLGVQMIVNLLLLKGNIGKAGAGICPVRGHSNVQGQRTVGITEKPEFVPLKKLEELYHFKPPTEKGLNTVETCEGIINGSVKAFIGLGGNFLRAVPETELLENSWRNLDLTVNIATKLNRTHIVHGKVSYVLPCKGRIEIDNQLNGVQSVSIEDSTGCFHGSKGQAKPASFELLSETAIIAKLARSLLGKSTKVDWDSWTADYSEIRKAIENTYPDIFFDFEKRQWLPGGFRRPMPAANRIWKTSNNKANFISPNNLELDPDTKLLENSKTLRLFTIRSDGQFNTTIYNLNDRFRGVFHTRKVLLISNEDMVKHGFKEGNFVDIMTASDDEITRKVEKLRIIPYDIPAGIVAGYFPECNPLFPLWHYAKKSMVPAFKSLPVYVSLCEKQS